MRASRPRSHHSSSAAARRVAPAQDEAFAFQRQQRRFDARQAADPAARASCARRSPAPGPRAGRAAVRAAQPRRLRRAVGNGGDRWIAPRHRATRRGASARRSAATHSRPSRQLRAPVLRQGWQAVRPADLARRLVVGHETEQQQGVVQLVGVARLRPGFGAHPVDGVLLQHAQVAALAAGRPAPGARRACAAPRPARRRGTHTAGR